MPLRPPRPTSCLFLVGAAVCMAATAAPREIAAPPLHPDDAAAIHRVLKLREIGIQAADKAPFTFAGLCAELEGLGVERRSLRPLAVHEVGREAVFFSLVHDDRGRVLAIAGNGPWLPNAALAELAALPELRIIAMDHNVRPELGWKHPDFDGSGFAGFARSRLMTVRIGAGLQDKGLAALASVPSLRELAIGHSQITEAGLDPLRGHAGLTTLRISEMGRFPPRVLGIFASLPNLSSAGFGEAYVTYAGGLDLLEPCIGRLRRIDLRMCLVPAADLARLTAAHPAAEILTSTPEQIVKSHAWIANRILEKAGRPAGRPLAEALIAADKLERGLGKTWREPAAPE